VKREQRNGLIMLDCLVCDTYLVCGSNLHSHVKGSKHSRKLKELEDSVILQQIDNETETLVGLEYLVELVRTPELGMMHVCMLCGFSGNSSDILEHFKTLQHKKKFLVKVQSR
jgi:hypothetical protein